ncbi:hypothetical protein JMUB6875_77220 [Nocardia sp. JMUB6875]|uniref:FitA-like ribbon-helix-helix domain-containing protein n=1 Tax=Nocardia sp. JMUB6875 TaxID=3158170 RepID=UPI0032E54A4E
MSTGKKRPTAASLTIRNLDPKVKERLRKKAAQRGHSMEAEAREVLAAALAPSAAENPLSGAALIERLANLRKELDAAGVELVIPDRHES